MFFTDYNLSAVYIAESNTSDNSQLFTKYGNKMHYVNILKIFAKTSKNE